MTIDKKQGEVTIIARMTAISTAGTVSAANLQVDLDEFVIDGTEKAPASFDATAVTNLKAAIKAFYDNIKGIV